MRADQQGATIDSGEVTVWRIGVFRLQFLSRLVHFSKASPASDGIERRRWFRREPRSWKNSVSIGRNLALRESG
jgi:hypothetical protein